MRHYLLLLEFTFLVSVRLETLFDPCELHPCSTLCGGGVTVAIDDASEPPHAPLLLFLLLPLRHYV